MRKHLLASIALLLTNPAFAETRLEQTKLAEILPEIEVSSCDTIIDVKGYPVHLVKEEGKVMQAGLSLFPEEIKSGEEREMLLFIEEALLAKSLGVTDKSYNDVKIAKGIITDFKKLSPESPCKMSTANSKSMTAEWDNNGKKIAVSVSLGYDVGKSATRSEIENSFISRLKSSLPVKRKPLKEFQTEELEPYGDDMYILPGGSYQSKDITRNAYYCGDEAPTPLWSPEYPIESMSNLFILPDIRDEDTIVELTVLKHEYGEKETLKVPLQRLLAVCEEDGCIPFWGVEKYDDGVLEGALFMYNRGKGYDHVLKIECRPEEIIGNTGIIKGRASLFIPTNNVRDLYAPYIRKSESERIKYDSK